MRKTKTESFMQCDAIAIHLIKDTLITGRQQTLFLKVLDFSWNWAFILWLRYTKQKQWQEHGRDESNTLNCDGDEPNALPFFYRTMRLISYFDWNIIVISQQEMPWTAWTTFM